MRVDQFSPGFRFVHYSIPFVSYTENNETQQALCISRETQNNVFPSAIFISSPKANTPGLRPLPGLKGSITLLFFNIFKILAVEGFGIPEFFVNCGVENIPAVNK